MANEGMVMGISYKEFTRQSKRYINELATRCEQEYGLGTHERFLYDQRIGEITFINNDIVCVRAKFQDIGSLHTPTRSWLWSWNNQNSLPHTKDKMWTVKAFGEENGFRALTEPALEKISEKEGRRLAAMAINVLQADGGYMFRADNGLIIYLALFDIEKVSGWTLDRSNN